MAKGPTKKCPKCSEKFRSRKIWERHMRTKHGKVEVWT